MTSTSCKKADKWDNDIEKFLLNFYSTRLRKVVTLILSNFNHFGGKHCQTTALKNILDCKGIHLSEEMLFGLGGGIGYIEIGETRESAFRPMYAKFLEEAGKLIIGEPESHDA